MLGTVNMSLRSFKNLVKTFIKSDGFLKDGNSDKFNCLEGDIDRGLKKGGNNDFVIGTLSCRKTLDSTHHEKGKLEIIGCWSNQL